MSDFTRHRCIPTRGRRRSWIAWGEPEALSQAAEFANRHQCPVMVTFAPEGGTVRELCVVKPPKVKAGRRT